MIKIVGPKDYHSTEKTIETIEHPLNDDRFYNYAHSSGFRYEQARIDY